MKPIFSIIIPIYNSENTILESFGSIKKQKFFNKIEVILIDDASKDKSKKICKSIVKKNVNVKFIKNKYNLGVSKSRNKGIKLAKGDYIIFLDSDDCFIPKVLDQIYQKTKNKKYDVLYLNQNLKKDYVYKESNLAVQNLNTLNNFTCHCWNFVIKKNFLIENKIYFENIKIFEDQVFITDILLIGKNFYFFKKKILVHYEYPSSLSRRTNYSSAISCIKVIKRIILKNRNSRLSSHQTNFISKRLNFIFNILKIYFLSLRYKDVKKIILIIKYIKSLDFQFIRFKFLKQITVRNLTQKIKKDRIHLRDQIFKSLEHKRKNFKRYIFSCGVLGRSVILISKLNKVKIHGFLDNNERMIGSNFLGYDIMSPNFLLKQTNNQINKTIVFIVHNDNKTKKILSNQLLRYNIIKKNIIKLEFFKNLRDVR